MLPRMEGPEVLRRLRAEHASEVPVIMLTARDELPDKIAGFRAGADDYLTKPFALPELEVRLEALLLRAQGRNPRKRLQVGDLVLDLATLEAQRGGQVLHLYPACRKLLEVLMRASPVRSPASSGVRPVGRRATGWRSAALACLRAAPQRRRPVCRQADPYAAAGGLSVGADGRCRRRQEC